MITLERLCKTEELLSKELLEYIGEGMQGGKIYIGKFSDPRKQKKEKFMRGIPPDANLVWEDEKFYV